VYSLTGITRRSIFGNVAVFETGQLMASTYGPLPAERGPRRDQSSRLSDFIIIITNVRVLASKSWREVWRPSP